MTKLLSYKTERGIERALSRLRAAFPQRTFIRVILPDFSFGAGLVNADGKIVARVGKDSISKLAGIR